jgi:alkylation response protein AidB-like acyl-CoA dehydrogenase
MAQYTPPLRDMQFVLHELLDMVPTLKTIPAYADLDIDTVNAVLEEGGKFASEVLQPLNLSGDQEGCTLDKSTHEVTTPKGFKQAYAQYVEGGWPALSCDPAYGGQGLPQLLNQCFYEMLNSANQAWAMYPGLSHGAYECLHVHGTPEQKQLYLPKLSSGQWTGTMCLTEPHCGTDLGMLRSKAEPQADGSYKITGGKIFISSGEHDLAENIIHLVLARLPEAPQGSKGISLFIVPKFVPKADGTLGARNGITCGAIDDERRTHRCGESRPGPHRSGIPERRGLRQGPLADAQPVGPEGAGQTGRPDHRAPGRAQDAAHRTRLRRRCTGPRAAHGLAARPGTRYR